MGSREHVHADQVPESVRLQELVESLSDYIEQYHGGWVRMRGFDGETLQVELGGACESCGLSNTTLQGWIGGSVRQFFPHIKVAQVA